jgi:hypothetical protein
MADPSPAPQIIQVQIVPTPMTEEEQAAHAQAQAALDQAVKQFVTETDKTADTMLSMVKFMGWAMGFFLVAWLFFMFALVSRH